MTVVGGRALILALAIVATGSAAARAAVPPRADVATFAQLKAPLPYPYDEPADASPQAAEIKVAQAAARAKAHGKLLLVDLGGNWCGDCRILAATLALPNLKRFVSAHYEVVTVDVGRMNRNLQIPSRYGASKLDGVPSLLIVDPRTDKLLDEGHIAALADARHMSPQALADWLAQWPK